MSDGVRVKWTCPACGERHKLRWKQPPEKEATLTVAADCNACGRRSYGTLYRDGNTKKGRPLYRWRAG